MKNKSEKILSIKSNVIELKKVERTLKSFFDKNNISMCHFNKALLCLNEAVINSIEHGNKNDKQKHVNITISLDNNLLNFCIVDEGNGFNMNELEDPTCAKNLCKESGRGIHIIKTIADNIKYNNTGNSVQVEISCQ